MKTSHLLIVLSWAILLTQGSCVRPEEPSPNDGMFYLLPAKVSGVHFNNKLVYDDNMNIYTFRSFYNGGGVGLADFNSDGLVDIFFAGNQVDNALYLNRGALSFEEVSAEAGVSSSNIWSTGVSIVDINADGWPDIYVSKSGDLQGERRHNELFVNQGVKTNEDGLDIVYFIEKSREYGLDDVGLSTHAVFFDYDLDGDLDCYLLNNSFRSIGNYDLRLDQRAIRDTLGGNKLLRNNTIGHPKASTIFEDVSESAGIFGSAIGFGLGVTISDINGDGWPDIYVSNDFFEKDYLYINQRDGRFREEIDQLASELSLGAMGADIADINNDAWPDIFVTEMLPITEHRSKTKSLFENWNKYQANVRNGYHQQFSRNTLQLNQNGKAFAEIGRYAEVEASDWSWGALIADLDNDGWKDIFVANGIYKDILDQDYINFYADPANVRSILFDKKNGGLNKLIDKIPSEAIPNYVFRNRGDLRFEQVNKEWGLDAPSFSNGAAYADLDNDGDLDLVINNINMPSAIYVNTTIEKGSNHYVQCELRDTFSQNRMALGAKVYLYQGDQIQFVENYAARGFMSSVDTRIHFGLNDNLLIDSLVVIWPDGTRHIQRMTKADQVLHIYKQAEPTKIVAQLPQISRAILSSKSLSGIDFVHVENEYSDFDKESLLLMMNSNLGPAICEGDINNDGLTDIYFGGAHGQSGRLFVQQSNGRYKGLETRIFDQHQLSEDVDCIFFDANGDKLLDLYVASGSTEFGPNNGQLADRLYMNIAGKGFRFSEQILPTFQFENTSAVASLDYNGDGHLDLVVTTFVRPYAYGVPSSSYLLENDGTGIFKDVSHSHAAALHEMGMVTDVAVGDIDNDGDDDIVIVGQWMTPVLLINTGGIYTKAEDIIPDNLSGWWNCVELADVNSDGRPDILLGNIGLNTRLKSGVGKLKHLHVNDFDANGRIEQIFTYESGGNEYPFSQRNDLIKQLPFLAKKYPNFVSYGGQSIKDIFDPVVFQKSISYTLEDTRSLMLLTDSGGRFSVQPLPVEAQLFPIYSFLVDDVNADGHVDILLGGNQSRAKPEIGINMAGRVMLLLGDGVGNFMPQSDDQSGLNVRGEIRGIIKVRIKGEKNYIFAINHETPQIYEALMPYPR